LWVRENGIDFKTEERKKAASVERCFGGIKKRIHWK